MAESKKQIVADIKAHISKRGGSYSAWYVGVSKDPRSRLFQDHGVREKGDCWIYKQAYSSSAAREVEAHFVDQLGTDGGTGGGDQEAECVYAYKKNTHTTP